MDTPVLAVGLLPFQSPSSCTVHAVLARLVTIACSLLFLFRFQCPVSSSVTASLFCWAPDAQCTCTQPQSHKLVSFGTSYAKLSGTILRTAYIMSDLLLACAWIFFLFGRSKLNRPRTKMRNKRKNHAIISQKPENDLVPKGTVINRTFDPQARSGRRRQTVCRPASIGHFPGRVGGWVDKEYN